MRHSNPLLRKYEFETSNSSIADRFLKILYLFRVNPEDIYIMPEYFDISQIEFRTTEQKKEQIRYVFRRYAGEEVDKYYEIY